MKTLYFACARFLAAVVPVLLMMGGTAWFCDRIVGNADPIMHPFIYLSPFALIVGVAITWIGLVIVSDQEARSRERHEDRTTDL